MSGYGCYVVDSKPQVVVKKERPARLHCAGVRCAEEVPLVAVVKVRRHWAYAHVVLDDKPHFSARCVRTINVWQYQKHVVFQKAAGLSTAVCEDAAHH